MSKDFFAPQHVYFHISIHLHWPLEVLKLKDFINILK